MLDKQKKKMKEERQEEEKEQQEQDLKNEYHHSDPRDNKNEERDEDASDDEIHDVEIHHQTLHEAAESGNYKAAKALLRAKAEVPHPCHHDNSAMILAILACTGGCGGSRGKHGIVYQCTQRQHAVGGAPL